MATEIDTFFIPAADFANVIERASVAGTAANGPDSAGDFIPLVGIKLPQITIAEPDAFTELQWDVVAGPNAGELAFTISTLPNRNGKPITKFQYALDGDQGSPTWVDLPAGTTVGAYTATGVSAGTYTGTIALRAVNAIGNGAVSDLKTATVGAAATIFSDDFRDGTLGAHWTIEGQDTGGWDFTDNGAGDYYIRHTLTVAERIEENNARITQAGPLSDADFPVILMLPAAIATGQTAYRGVSLWFEQTSTPGSENRIEAMILAFGGAGGFTGRYVGGENHVNGTDDGTSFTNIGKAARGLRVRKTGTSWGFDSTDDGTNWTEFAAFTRSLTVDKVGIGHFGFNIAHVQTYDYFELGSDPISGEDA